MTNYHEMKIGIIADSSCDVTEELQSKLHVTLIPFQMDINNHNYVDDGTVNIQEFINEMKISKETPKSACPSIGEYEEAMRQFDVCFVITISSRLSGSYNSACAAAQMISEDASNHKIFVVDSKSASCGETAIALFINDLIHQGVDPDEIFKRAEEFVEKQLTLFTLIDLDNLFKNGRISKFSKITSSTFNLRPIMKANDGEIELLKIARGTKKAFTKMVEMMNDFTKNAKMDSLRLIMTHCNCESQAMQIKEKLLECCNTLKEVIVIPTGALSSMYANDGGIIMACLPNNEV